MTHQLVSQPDHGDSIIHVINGQGVASPRLQIFFDDITSILDELSDSGGGGAIDLSTFSPSSVIYRPSTGTDILPAVIDESEFLGRLPGGEIKGLGFVDAWSILGNGTTDITINAPGGANAFIVETSASSKMFQVSGSNNLVSISRSGITGTDGMLHIIHSTAQGGVVQAHSTGNELVLEHDFDSGMSILSGFNSFGNIYFGSPTWGEVAGNLWMFHDNSAGAIGATSITSVTDSGGVARFNHGGTDPVIGQTVTISGYVVNTDYNDSLAVTAVGSGYFEISTIAFGTNEAGGSFIGVGIGYPAFGLDLIGKTIFKAVSDQLDGTTTGLFVNPDQDALIDFQINTFSEAPFMRTLYDSAFGVGRMGLSQGVSFAPTMGILHIFKNGSSGFTGIPNINSDHIVLESNGLTGITFLGGPSEYSGLGWGDQYDGNPRPYQVAIVAKPNLPPNTGLGRIELRVDTGTVARMYITKDRVTVNPIFASEMTDFKVAGTTVDSTVIFADANTSRLTTSNINTIGTDGQFHVIRGGLAGTVTASTLANGIVVESNVDAGISILVPNDGSTANLYFGAPTSGNNAGQVRMVPSTGIMTLLTGAVSRLTLAAAECVFNSTSADTDFKVKGTATDLLFCDAGNAHVKVDASLEFTKRLDANATTVTGVSHTAGDEHVILVDDDTAGAAVTVTLPTAATAKTIYHIKKIGSTASVTIDGNGAELIDGATTAVLTIQYESITVISDGSAWWVL